MKLHDLPHHLLPKSLRDLATGAQRAERISDTLGNTNTMGNTDNDTISDTIQRAFASAGLNTRSGGFKTTSDTINSALSAAGLMPAAPRAAGHGTVNQSADVKGEVIEREVIEGEARVIDTEHDLMARTVDEPAKRGTGGGRSRSARGELFDRSFTNHAGSRQYKLYVPSSYSNEGPADNRERVPLVVMLHGCTQSAEDFAAGTRMNALAEQHGFLVAWPVQPSNANHSRCWNWFRPQDQARERGEPALIADITREIASSYRVDTRRVFVAGLSAGAAMAVILGATYPELYAAVGAHSGLPYGVAHDLPSALAAMRGGRAHAGGPGSHRPATATTTADGADAHPGVPIIVFHGDSDHTVHVRNGEVILDESLAACPDRAQLRVESMKGGSSNGRAYTRAIHRDAAGQAVAEAWTLHGAGHAWSGGSANGSFTDERGPDASAEMIRFFYEQPRAGTA